MKVVAKDAEAGGRKTRIYEEVFLLLGIREIVIITRGFQ